MTVTIEDAVLDDLMDVKDGEEGCDVLRRLRESLRGDITLRERGPLMIKPLVDISGRCGEGVSLEVSLLLMEIAHVSKYHESFTFFIEAWVDTRHVCQSLRPTLLRCLTSCLCKATKGPLARNKTQYLVQLCSLLVKDYFSNECTSLSPEIFEALFNLLKDASDDAVFKEEHERNEMAVICRRDMLSVLLLRLNKHLKIMNFKEQLSKLHREFFSGSGKYSEIYRLILGRAKSLRAEEAENVAYIDLHENDIAWFTSASVSTASLPVVLTSTCRTDLLIRSCANHIHANEASQACDDFVAASDQYDGSDCLSDIINLAVTASPKDGPLGSIQGVSMCQRSAVYAAYVKVISRLPLLHVMELTCRFVFESRNDTVVGIFVKVAKDKWSTSEICPACVDLYMKICRNILASEFAISDATDSLIGILNWTRFILIKDKSVLKDTAFFKSTLDILCNKVDAELKAADMETRVLLIASLLRRVRELF